MRIRVAFFLFLMFVWIGSIFGASQKFLLSYFDYEDGLPSDLVKIVCKDSTGFLWIGTDGGLVRFDGQKFTNYSQGLPSLYVKDICCLKRHSLVVATDLGIMRLTYDAAWNVKIETLIPGKTIQTDSTLYFPKKIFKAHDGSIWIAEANAIVHYKKGSKRFKRYHFSQKYLGTSYTHSFLFFEDARGRLMALSISGYLLRYHAEIDSFVEIHLANRPKDWSANVLAAGTGQPRGFWVGSNDGLYWLEENPVTESWQLTKVGQITNIQAIALNGRGDILLGTSDHGLIWGEKKAKGYAFEPIKETQLYVVNHIAATKENQFWISTDKGLLHLYKPLFRKVVNFSNYAIQNLFKVSDQRLLASDGNILYELKEKGGNFRIKRFFWKHSSIISTVAADSNNFYTGYIDGKVTIFRGKTQKEIRLPFRNTVISICPDNNGRIWVAQSERNTIFRLNSNGVLKAYGEKQGIFSPVQIVKKSAKRVVYAGGKGERHYLYRYLPGEDRFENVSIPLNLTNYRTLTIFDLAFMPEDSVIYLASNLGIVKIKDRSARILSLNGNRTARSVAIDKNGRLWVGTEHGAFCLADSEFIYFDETEGFDNRTFSFRSAVRDGKGRLLFGTYQGIYLQQRPLKTIMQTNAPIITDFWIDEKKFTRFNTLSVTIPFHATLRLMLSTLMYPAEKVMYQYRFVGRDSRWKNLTKTNLLIIPSLQVGSFDLELRARQVGHRWSPVTHLHLTVRAPWYLSSWALMLYTVVFLIVLLIGFELYRERKKRKKIYQDLLNSEIKLKTIVTNAPIILFTLDKKGTITFADGKGMHEFGERFTNVIGMNFCETFKDDMGMISDCKRAVNGEVFESIRRVFDKYYRFWFSPLMNEKNEAIGALGVAIDITELKEIEAKLRHAIVQAEAANKAKTEFIANMSHEIRTPMNAIIGLSDLLLQTPLNEEQQDYLKTIRFSAKELLKIINQILDFSKIDSGKIVLEFVPFNLKRLVKNIANGFEVMAKNKGLDFELEWDERIPENVIGDPTRIGQVFINLLGNALKFTEKGWIKFKAQFVAETEETVDIHFEISDTGIGIPKEKKDTIFKSFQQVDSSLTRKFGGTGLGLSITGNLVEMMGSHIEVESEVNKGSKFYFVLTLAKAKDKQIEELPDFSLYLTYEDVKKPIEKLDAAKTPDEPDTITVLIVEDNVINQRVAKRMVEKMGFKTEIANNGQEALDMLQEKSYDLILLDVQMPVLDGLRTAQKIRIMEMNSEQHIPIIAMTAHAQKEDRDRCLEAGMDDYISKPINMQILEEKLRLYLKKKLEARGDTEEQKGES